MPALPLAGPSSPLRTNSAEVRRVVNWEPMRIESGTGKGGADTYLKQVAGLKFLGNVGPTIRALKTAQDRLFAVTDAQLVEVFSNWTSIGRGGIGSGSVAMADNETQLGIVNGASGYSFDLATNTLSSIVTNWPGSTTLGVLDGWGILTSPNSNKFYLTDNQDFTNIDALNFASADSSPGNIVAADVGPRSALFLKERSGEAWYASGDADFALARDQSALIEVGCTATRSLCRVGGVVYWLGRDERGSGVVFGMPGYQPQRISSTALEEQLAKISDLSGATAWVYHQEGQSRYVLNVPGLETTWVYNAAAGIWHERGEWANGQWSQWRATCHAFCFGKHIVGDASGNLFELSPTTNMNNADVLRRFWRSPHNSTPTNSVETFSSLEILCDTGQGKPDMSAPTMLMRYSNDGGRNWQDAIEMSLGAIGETQARAREIGLGSARDRVWEIVVTDDVQCDVVSALVNEL